MRKYKSETYTELEGTIFVVKQNLPIITSLGEMILKDMFASQCDMHPKVLPTRNTDHE